MLHRGSRTVPGQRPDGSGGAFLAAVVWEVSAGNVFSYKVLVGFVFMFFYGFLFVLFFFWGG